MSTMLYNYKIMEVHRVIDGDTLECLIDLGFGVYKNITIRLNGIDTPETKNLKAYAGTVLKQVGDDATIFVEKRLSLSHELIFKSLAFEGKYGRSVGDIMMDGISLCKTLIEADLAIPYINDPERRIEEMLKLNERVKHRYVQS